MAINLLASVFSFIINASISLFLTPFIVNHLGNEAYGFIPLAMNFVTYILIFTAALNSMASRFITIELTQGNNELANKYFNSVLMTNFIICSIISLPSIVLISQIDNILNVPLKLLSDVRITFIIVLINTFISLIFNVFSIATFAKNRLDLRSLKMIQGYIIRIVVILALFIFFEPRIYFVVLSSLFFTIYIATTNYGFTRKLLPNFKIKFNDFRWHLVKKLLSSGIWNSINQLSTVLTSSIDILIANIFINASASGQFAIVKTLPLFIISFSAMIASVFVPKFVILYGEKKMEELKSTILNSTTIVGILLALPIGFLIVMADTFYSLWVPIEDAQYLHLLTLIVIAPLIFSSSNEILFNVYSVTNKLKVPSLIMLGIGFANTILTLLLLQFTNLGLIAIGLTTAILAIMRDLLFTPIYSAKCLGFKKYIFYIPIIKGFIYTTVAIVVTSLFRYIISPSSWMSFIITGLGVCVISISINTIIGFGPNRISLFIKSRNIS